MYMEYGRTVKNVQYGLRTYRTQDRGLHKSPLEEMVHLVYCPVLPPIGCVCM